MAHSYAILPVNGQSLGELIRKASPARTAANRHHISLMSANEAGDFFSLSARPQGEDGSSRIHLAMRHADDGKELLPLDYRLLLMLANLEQFGRVYEFEITPHINRGKVNELVASLISRRSLVFGHATLSYHFFPDAKESDPPLRLQLRSASGLELSDLFYVISRTNSENPDSVATRALAGTSMVSFLSHPARLRANLLLDPEQDYSYLDIVAKHVVGIDLPNIGLVASHGH